jgi:hypothetical protein
MQREKTEVPADSAWLGGLGAVPFVALAVALPGLDGPPRNFVIQALLGYGAVILSFLGGIHWGIAIAPRATPEAAGRGLRLAWSVVPSLVGWAALLAPPVTGLLALGIAFAVMLGADLRATKLGVAPAWYPRLRFPLSLTVVAALMVAAVSLRLS